MCLKFQFKSLKEFECVVKVDLKCTIKSMLSQFCDYYQIVDLITLDKHKHKTENVRNVCFIFIGGIQSINVCYVCKAI